MDDNVRALRESRDFAADFLAADPSRHAVLMPGLYIDRSGRCVVTHHPERASQRVAVPVNYEEAA